MRPILDSPAELVTRGRFNLGTFKAPLDRVNPLDARIGPAWLHWPRWLKRFRLKEWQHFAVVSDQLYASVALFDAKAVALAQICVYQRETGETHFLERRVLPWRVRLPDELFDAEAHFADGTMSIDIENRLSHHRHEVDFTTTGAGSGPAMCGHLSVMANPQRFEPVVVALPLGRGGGMYSHKMIAPATGTVEVGGERFSFTESRSYCLIDIHKGYYPFVTKWHWATGGGFAGDGRLVGFNLTDNQVVDQESYNENCLWLDGRLIPLPPVTFSFDRGNVRRPWQVADREGRVAVSFSPEVVRRVDAHAVLFESRYRAPLGTFGGHLVTDRGDEVSLEQFFGMTEDFYLRV